MTTQLQPMTVAEAEAMCSLMEHVDKVRLYQTLPYWQSRAFMAEWMKYSTYGVREKLSLNAWVAAFHAASQV